MLIYKHVGVGKEAENTRGYGGKFWEEMQSGEGGLEMFVCVIEMMSTTQGKYAPVVRVKLKSALGGNLCPVLAAPLPLLPRLPFSHP